jgi:hypothetical protein
MFKKNKEHKGLAALFIDGDLEKFTPTLDQLKAIYLNKIDKVYTQIARSRGEEGSWLGISYEANEHGYRSPEFNKPADILTLGCSQTFGIGIESIENIWPSILSKKMNLSYANLGRGGSSINSQIRQAHAYINQYGKPKHIFAIFPDFDRFEFPVSKEALVPNKDKPSLKYLEILHKKNPGEIQKVSVMPHDARDVIPPQVSHFFSAQYILMFEKYCKEAGINLVWSTWSIQDQILVSKLKEIDKESYTNFIELKEYKWHRNHELQIEEYRNSSLQKIGDVVNCHQEFSHLRDFYIALDISVGLHGAHSGVHHHLHWAEIMHEHAVKNNWK